MKTHLGTFDKVYKPHKHRADNSAPEWLAALTIAAFVASIFLILITH